jgi:hypothetical protein
MTMSSAVRRRPKSKTAKRSRISRIGSSRPSRSLRSCKAFRGRSDYLESMERNGATGRTVEFLRNRVELREMEIEDIPANGRFP